MTESDRLCCGASRWLAWSLWSVRRTRTSWGEQALRQVGGRPLRVSCRNKWLAPTLAGDWTEIRLSGPLVCGNTLQCVLAVRSWSVPSSSADFRSSGSMGPAGACDIQTDRCLSFEA